MTEAAIGTLLKGRVALVTGASRGIGRAIAIGLAEQGAAVSLVARTETDLESGAAQIRSSGGVAIAVRADLKSATDITASVEKTTRELGPVDILVNNAGDNILGKFLEQDEAEWWNQMDVGIRAPYRYCRAVLGSMVERGWGRIINILSIAGKRAGKFNSAYATAKHAGLGLTRALATEFGQTNVTINAICPGWFRTDLTDRTIKQRSELFGVPTTKIHEMFLAQVPQRVVMEPEEIVPLTVFLASPGSQRITGQAINICGGAVMF